MDGGKYVDEYGVTHDLDEIVPVDPDVEYDDGTGPMTYRELIDAQAEARASAEDPDGDGWGLEKIAADVGCLEGDY